jgi:hypothetical protein
VTFTREEYVERARARTSETGRQAIPQMVQIQMAAVSAKLLTGDPEWDKFLQHLQAVRNQVQADWEVLGAELDDISIVDPNLVMGIKTRRVAMSTNIELLDAIMQLPLDLISGGDQAEKIMKRFSDVEGSAT